MRRKNTRKKLSGFIQEDSLKPAGDFGHATKIFRKQPKGSHARDKKIWYVKQAYDNEPVEVEIVAGELYRLLIGNLQPKTRLIEDHESNRYVASEGIEDFANFKTIHPDTIFDSENKKLFARILLASMLLGEIDLKADNIGVNRQNRMIKIDHDSSFWPVIAKENPADLNRLDFDYQDLENIARPIHYQPSVWGGGLSPRQLQMLNDDVEFKSAVHEEIIKILLCPDSIIQSIIDLNITDDKMRAAVTEFMKQRIQKLGVEAFRSKEFLHDAKTFNATQAMKIRGEYLDFLQANPRYPCDDASFQMQFSNKYNVLKHEMNMQAKVYEGPFTLYKKDKVAATLKTSAAMMKARSKRSKP